MNDIKQNIIPMIDENNRGVVEKPIMLSIEYANNFQKFHLVVPATLSVFSNVIHLVLKPTQENIPLE